MSARIPAPPPFERDTHTVVSLRGDDTTESCSSDSWRVQRIESVPMSAEQHRDAVQALAALIIEWQKTRHSEQKQMNEARDQAA